MAMKTYSILSRKWASLSDAVLRHTFEAFFWESIRAVVANLLDCDITISEFEHNSRYYILVQTNTVYGGARGVMVIVVGNGHGDSSSNPGRDWLHFT